MWLALHSFPQTTHPMTTPNHRQHIIAIGASAGGLEAIHAFFDHTPLDKVSYVVIQHLSPDHQSRLAELLATHSKLQICLAENNMLVEPNRVYVISNQVYLTIREGRFQLTDKRDKAGPHMTIDAFFVSLALDWGEKAIGVILSGTGNDGSKGIQAIHQAGGWVIAQDPATAKFGTMPANAIDTGFADVVLAPGGMAEAIQAYVNQKINGPLAPAMAEAIQGNGNQKITDLAAPALQLMQNRREEGMDEPDESALVAILDLIKSQLPLDFSDYKRATIFRRIRRRMEHHHVSHTDTYLAFLQNNPLELESLAKDFLISVTSFFRDTAAFEIIERDIVPAVVGKAGGDTVKIWVAGCATGEEAYSLAMLVQEYLDKTHQQREVKIFATDLDKAALAIASKGVYDSRIAQEVLPARLERFFTPEGEGFKIRYHIRKMLIFAQHDLGKNPPYCNIDLITCRNLLIYLNPVLQKKIFSMLHFGLRQGGYLFLGSSENAQWLAPPFREISKKWKIYQKTEKSLPIQFDNFYLPETEERRMPGQYPIPSVAKSPVAFPLISHLSELLIETLVSHYGQVGVCLDENRRVVQAFGDLTPYLLPKVFNLNLLELLPEALSVAVGTACNRALESNEPVSISGIRNELEQTGAVHLLVKPFVAARTGQKLLLVLLSPDTLPTINGQESEPFDQNQHTREYIIHLEKEVQGSKDSLQVVTEKLEANNENMQSFNEELLSANEEMQSGNEELQSVNEELQTINTEYQLKIKELTELNDDLNNYFRSNVSGQLFVDKSLLLKKFSPAAVQHINLRETDIGRPLHHITTNIQFETIVKDIQEVIASGGTITKEVEDTTGKWYQVMAMPYIRQADKQPDGAMVTFYDITELKRVQQELKTSNDSLLRINGDLDNFVYTASHDLVGPLSNVEGLLQVLQRKLVSTDTEVLKIYGMLHSSLAKFKALIKDLAALGKVESNMQIKTEIIDLDELLQDIRLSNLYQIEATQTTIKTDLQEKQLFFSKKNLRSILYNLISNSIKYKSAERDPEIMLSTEAVPGFLVLTVRDNGMGMSADKLPTIFTLYKRLSQEVEGQGIGLYLVKKIIDATGGKVEVESEVGKGTTFKLFFKVEPG